MSISIKQLREAIPPNCFQSSYRQSFYLLFRNVSLMLLMIVAIVISSSVPSLWLRFILRQLCSFSIGLLATGLWIIAHECGHGAFSPNQFLNDAIGWILHSFLLVPYFSWKISHQKHHRYTGHMDRDVAFVPPRAELAVKSKFAFLKAMSDDAPIISLLKLIRHQLLGWPLYLLFSISAGSQSNYPSSRTLTWWNSSLFDPSGAMIGPKQWGYVLLSDFGVAITLRLLYCLQQKYGWTMIFYTYVLPYVWTNHWMVAITYLNHTHPKVPRYEANSWTFKRGALTTIDRSFGWIGEHLFHNVIETHVLHHLFPRIPCYKAREATASIIPLLGESYHHDDTPFIVALWQTFRVCVQLEAKPLDGKDSAMRTWSSLS